MHAPATRLPTRSRGLRSPRARVVGQAVEAEEPRRPPCSTISTVWRAESFADDLNTRRGIVSGRVALLPRSAEIQPFVAPIRPSPLSQPKLPPTFSRNDTGVHLPYLENITSVKEEAWMRRGGLGNSRPGELLDALANSFMPW